LAKRSNHPSRSPWETGIGVGVGVAVGSGVGVGVGRGVGVGVGVTVGRGVGVGVGVGVGGIIRVLICATAVGRYPRSTNILPAKRRLTNIHLFMILDSIAFRGIISVSWYPFLPKKEY